MNEALNIWICQYPDKRCAEVSGIGGYRCDKPKGHLGEHEATVGFSW